LSIDSRIANFNLHHQFAHIDHLFAMKMKITKKNLTALLAIAAALLFLASCEDDLKIDPKFSVNVVTPGPKWPNKDKLTPAQKEIFEKYGKPDAFRLIWNTSGRYMLQSDLAQMLGNKKPSKLPPYTWIYQQRGIEVSFQGPSPVETPINDQLRLVLKYGDPESVKETEGGITQWQFYSVGYMYKFSKDGRIIQETTFPAMGKFFKN